MLLPVVVRERCVLILYGDHGPNDVELGAIGELIAFAPLVSVSLERVIVKRKLMARGEEGTSGPESAFAARAGRSRAPKPDLKERAMALARALDLPRTSSHPPPLASSARPPTTPSTAPAPNTAPIPNSRPRRLSLRRGLVAERARARAPSACSARGPSHCFPRRPNRRRISRPTAAEAEATASALRRAVVPIGDSGPPSRSRRDIAPAHPVISVGGEPRRNTPAQGTPSAIGVQAAMRPRRFRSPAVRPRPTRRVGAEVEDAGLAGSRSRPRCSRSRASKPWSAAPSG